MKPRTHIIWSISSEDFAKLVESSQTIGQVLGYFGLENKGRNAHTASQRIKEEGLDVAHFRKPGKGVRNGGGFEAVPLNSVLVADSTYNRKSLKRRLISDGLIRNECYECGQQPEWNGKPLVMVLDHINGVNNDNRIDNLRMLCPNCNSQTETFSGRNCRKVIQR